MTKHNIQFQIAQFIHANNLKPADAILVKKLPYRLLNHFIIYLGIRQNLHCFMANTIDGVKVYNYSQLLEELRTFQPEGIERFIGSERDRKDAVERALTRKDEASYSLIVNNCEHFKNWVQKGEHKSVQVDNAGILMAGTGAAILFSGKSENAQLTGLGLLVAGGLIWAFGNDTDAAGGTTIISRLS